MDKHQLSLLENYRPPLMTEQEMQHTHNLFFSGVSIRVIPYKRRASRQRPWRKFGTIIKNIFTICVTTIRKTPHV